MNPLESILRKLGFKVEKHIHEVDTSEFSEAMDEYVGRFAMNTKQFVPKYGFIDCDIVDMCDGIIEEVWGELT